jgi:hypothetical protein
MTNHSVKHALVAPQKTVECVALAGNLVIVQEKQIGQCDALHCPPCYLVVLPMYQPTTSIHKDPLDHEVDASTIRSLSCLN